MREFIEVLGIIFICMGAAIVLDAIIEKILDRKKRNVFILTSDGLEKYDRTKKRWVSAKLEDIKSRDRVI